VQFIIFLDATIVNVALPSIRDSLHFSEQQLTWVVNGYLLTAGGLLLVGGRLGDMLGRRRMFAVGAALFAAASILAAVSANAETLLVARFVQGTAEACAAPAALGMIALTFTVRGSPRRRSRSGAGSPGWGRPSGWCCPVSSPTWSAGGGSSGSTCRWPSFRWSWSSSSARRAGWRAGGRSAP
jgi:MFS family permease